MGCNPDRRRAKTMRHHSITLTTATPFKRPRSQDVYILNPSSSPFPIPKAGTGTFGVTSPTHLLSLNSTRLPPVWVRINSRRVSRDTILHMAVSARREGRRRRPKHCALSRKARRAKGRTVTLLPNQNVVLLKAHMLPPKSSDVDALIKLCRDFTDNVASCFCILSLAFASCLFPLHLVSCLQ